MPITLSCVNGIRHGLTGPILGQVQDYVISSTTFYSTSYLNPPPYSHYLFHAQAFNGNNQPVGTELTYDYTGSGLPYVPFVRTNTLGQLRPFHLQWPAA